MAKSTCKNLYKNFVLAFDKTDTPEIFQEVSSLHFRNKGDKGCSCILGKFASQVKILHESHDVSIDDHLEPLKEHHRKIIQTRHPVTTQIKNNRSNFLFLKSYFQPSNTILPRASKGLMIKILAIPDSLVYSLTKKKSLMSLMMFSRSSNLDSPSIKKEIMLVLIQANANRRLVTTMMFSSETPA